MHKTSGEAATQLPSGGGDAGIWGFHVTVRSSHCDPTASHAGVSEMTPNVT